MEFIVWVIFVIATIIPMVKLLPHFGIHQYWAAACVIPLGVLALLWWMAIKLQELESK